MSVLTGDRDAYVGLPNPSPGNSRLGSRRPTTGGSKSDLAGRSEKRADCSRGGSTVPTSHAPRAPGPSGAGPGGSAPGAGLRRRAREGGGKGWGRGLRLGGRRRRRRQQGAGKREAGSSGLSRGAAAAAAPGMAAAPLLLLLLLVPVPLLPLLAQGPGGALGNRHAVYWNSSNQQ